MATTTATPQSVANPPSRRLFRRLATIALIALLAAGVAGAGTWYFMSRHPGAPASHAARAEPAPSPLPVFFPLEAMTVNLQSDDGDAHYLRIGLTLKLHDQATADRLTAHMPEIRSRVLLALSNKHPDELAPLAGKEALAKELTALIARPTDAGEPPARVDGVLFTEFVVQ